MSRDIQATLQEIAQRTEELRAGLAALASGIERSSAAQAQEAVRRERDLRAVSEYVDALEGRVKAQLVRPDQPRRDAAKPRPA